VGGGSKDARGVTQLVVLDNEAIQALRDPAHPKHRHVIGHVQILVDRKRRAVEITIVAPTAIRVEAGWDRSAPSWALPNRLRITDAPLETQQANAAAAIRNRTGVSVGDAHAGAVIRSAVADRVTVVTSDPADMRLAAGDRAITVVVI
jgi:hypothetical protein